MTRAGLGFVELVIIVVFMAFAVPLLKTLIMTNAQTSVENTTHEDKSLTVRTADEFDIYEGLKLDFAQARIMVLANNDNCPDDMEESPTQFMEIAYATNGSSYTTLDYLHENDFNQVSSFSRVVIESGWEAKRESAFSRIGNFFGTNNVLNNYTIYDYYMTYNPIEKMWVIHKNRNNYNANTYRWFATP